MLPLLSASTLRFRYGWLLAPASFSSTYASKRSPVRLATGWSLSDPLLSSTLAPAAAAPGAPVSYRNEPSPNGGVAGPVTNPGRTEPVRNSTPQPCNAPGRTTSSTGAVGAVCVMVRVAVARTSTPLTGAVRCSSTVSPSSTAASARIGMPTERVVTGSAGSKVMVPSTGV